MNLRAVFVILWWCAGSALLAQPAAAQAPDATQTAPADPLALVHFRPPDKWRRIPVRRTNGSIRVLGMWAAPAVDDAPGPTPNLVLGYVRFTGTLEEFVARQESELKTVDSRTTVVAEPVRKQFCLSTAAYVVRLQLAEPNDVTVLEEQAWVVTGGGAFIVTYSYVEPVARPSDLLDAEAALESLCGGAVGVPA